MRRTIEEIVELYTEILESAHDKAFEYAKSQCMYDACPKCQGSGKDYMGGGFCLHMISCPCPKCSPRC